MSREVQLAAVLEVPEVGQEIVEVGAGRIALEGRCFPEGFGQLGDVELGTSEVDVDRRSFERQVAQRSTAEVRLPQRGVVETRALDRAHDERRVRERCVAKRDVVDARVAKGDERQFCTREDSVPELFDAIELRVANRRAVESRVVELRSGQVRIDECRIDETSVRQVGLPQVDFMQVETDEVGVRQVGSDHVAFRLAPGIERSGSAVLAHLVHEMVVGHRYILSSPMGARCRRLLGGAGGGFALRDFERY